MATFKRPTNKNSSYLSLSEGLFTLFNDFDSSPLETHVVQVKFYLILREITKVLSYQIYSKQNTCVILRTVYSFYSLNWSIL